MGLKVDINGNVGIGTPAPQSKLAVAGVVTAQKVKVTTTGWPDYVFHEDYQLTSLSELESFVAKNKHLPGIPSAQVMATEGQDVGEMNRLLLQKVEELTLYLIAEHKEKQMLVMKVDTLTESLKKLETELMRISR